MKKLVVAALALSSLLWGQAPARRRRPADTLVSPEVRSDRRVTFRLRAPKAAEVTVRGNWDQGQTPERLEKDASGVWSVTIGPLEPDLYSYTLSIDGVAVVDPHNPLIMPGARSTESLVEVPADPPRLQEARDVPHGAVAIHWYHSEVLGETRRVYVYTPPGYEKNPTARYPVLYLLHGSGDTEAEWTWVGRANLILDSLLAEGKARPMLIVMPFGHAVPASDTSPASRGRNTELFEKDLLQGVLPLVESTYRTAPGPRNRAIAGLSMGGGQSLNIGLAHLDLFGSIGVFSSSGGPDFETRFHDLLADPEGTNRKLSLFWIAIGRDDPGLARAKQLDASLTAHGIRHAFQVTEGRHTWTVWRRYLAEVLPQLFESRPSP